MKWGVFFFLLDRFFVRFDGHILQNSTSNRFLRDTKANSLIEIRNYQITLHKRPIVGLNKALFTIFGDEDQYQEEKI